MSSYAEHNSNDPLISFLIEARSFPTSDTISKALEGRRIVAHIVGCTDDKKYWEVAVREQHIIQLQTHFKCQQNYPYELLPIATGNIREFGLYKAEAMARESCLPVAVKFILDGGGYPLARYLARRSPLLQVPLIWAAFLHMYNTATFGSRMRFCRFLRFCKGLVAGCFSMPTDNDEFVIDILLAEMAKALEQRISCPIYDEQIELHCSSLFCHILESPAHGLDRDSSVSYSINLLLCGSMQLVGRGNDLKETNDSAVISVESLLRSGTSNIVYQHLRILQLQWIMPCSIWDCLPYHVRAYASPYITSKIEPYIECLRLYFPKEPMVTAILIGSSVEELHSEIFLLRLQTWLLSPYQPNLSQTLFHRLAGPQTGSEFVLSLLTITAYYRHLYRGNINAKSIQEIPLESVLSDFDKLLSGRPVKNPWLLFERMICSLGQALKMTSPCHIAFPSDLLEKFQGRGLGQESSKATIYLCHRTNASYPLEHMEVIRQMSLMGVTL